MTSEINGLNQAIRNASDGQSMAATAEGAMVEISDMLQRMRELAVQGSTGTLNTNDRSSLDQEMSQLKAEIDRIASVTSYNSMNLLDGTASVALQIGSNSTDQISFSVGSLSTSSLGTSDSALTTVSAVEASTVGTVAKENVANLTFNGNDTYSFTIVLDGKTESSAGVADKEITVTASMTGSDATSIAQAINNAVAGNATDTSGTPNGADISGILSATAFGSTVTLTAADGKSVDISGFTSVGNGSMTVNQVTNATADSVTLEDVTEVQGVINTGGQTATASEAVLQLDEDKQYQFRVNDTLIEVSGVTGEGADTALAIKNAIDAVSGQNAATVAFTDHGAFHSYDIKDATGRDISISGFQKLTSAAVPDGTLTFNDGATSATSTTVASGEFLTADLSNTGTALSIADGDTGSVSFSNQDLKYTFQMTLGGSAKTYVIDGETSDFQAELSRVATAITADGGSGVSAINRSGVLEIANTTGSAVAFVGTVAMDAPGEAAVTEGNAYFGQGTFSDFDAIGTGTGLVDEANITTLLDGSIVQTTNGVEAVGSQMTLDVQGDDRYAFTIDKDNDGGSDATIAADVTGGDLNGLINAINAHSSTTGIVAALSSGQVSLTKADGTAFALTSFSAENSGSIIASNAVGQGSPKVLQNTNLGTGVSIAASGAAVESSVELSFSGADAYSFQISDGTSTSIVRATDVLVAGVTGGASATLVDDSSDVAAMKSEIQTALNQANMSHITVSETGGKITLTNELGGALNITNFKSVDTGTMSVATVAGQGVGKILNDDGVAGASASIAEQYLTTVESAKLAIDAIDRAIENVNAERSNLGAVVNRLDHTVNNLTNIVVNTEASRGRIEDADFATESTALSKAQILQQASTAMLAQANASKQGVLSLLQG